jgi:hypothetical protein
MRRARTPTQPCALVLKLPIEPYDATTISASSSSTIFRQRSID